MDRDGFIDRSQRFSYLLACENARRIASDPGILALASEHLEQFARQDPRKRDGYRLWRTRLDGQSEEIITLLTERSPRADYVRETAPISRECRSPRGRVCWVSRAHRSRT